MSLVDRDAPKELAVTVKNLELVLIGIALSDKRSSLKLDLVVAEVGSLMPYVEVLMGEVQWPGRVLLDAPVESLDALASLAVSGILEELEACAAEALLLLEDGLVGDGDLYSLELGAVEARGFVGELEDLRPGQVVALDEVGVEDGVGGSRVEEGGCGADRDTAIEDDGALELSANGVGVGVGVKVGRSQYARGN